MEDVAAEHPEELQLASEDPEDDAEAIARKTKGNGYIEQDNL